MRQAIIIDMENRTIKGSCKASDWKQHFSEVRELIEDGVSK